MKPIYIVKNINDFDFNKFNDFLIVCHDSIAIKPNHIKWSDYKINFLDYDKYNNILLIGTNYMINPHNRCDYINDYLATMTRNKNKVCVNLEPFIGSPWRIFWQFQFANLDTDIFGTNYSYPVEGDYDNWFMRKNNSKFFDNNVVFEKIKILVETNLLPKTHNVEFYDLDNKFYEETKYLLLETHNTLNKYLQSIIKIMNKHYQVNYSWDSYLSGNYKLPNLKIYKFMHEENIRRLKIYNLFTRD
jgi:hypothetical protein